MLAMYYRELLGDLSPLAYEAIKELMIEAANNDKARPGVIAVQRTYLRWVVLRGHVGQELSIEAAERHRHHAHEVGNLFVRDGDFARIDVDGDHFTFELVSFSGWPAALAVTAVKDKTRILCIRGDSSFRFARK